MASFLDARAHHGRWLLRIEDIDTPRVVPGADLIILSQLQQLGMRWDGDIIWQSQRLARYADIFAQLEKQGQIYGCACTRQEIASNACRPGCWERTVSAPTPAPVGPAFPLAARPVPGA